MPARRVDRFVCLEKGSEYIRGVYVFVFVRISVGFAV